MEYFWIVVAAAVALAVVLFWAWRPDPELSLVSRLAGWLANTLNIERAATMTVALILLIAVAAMHSCSTNDLHRDVASLDAEQTQRFDAIERTQAAHSVTLDALLRGQPRSAPAAADAGSAEVLEAISALRAEVRDLRQKVEAPAAPRSFGAGWLIWPALFFLISTLVLVATGRWKTAIWTLLATLSLGISPTLELGLKNQFTLERLFDISFTGRDGAEPDDPPDQPPGQPPPPPEQGSAPPRVTNITCNPAWRIGDFTPNAAQAFSDGGSLDSRVARVLEALREEPRWRERAAIVLIGSADTMRRSRPNAELAATRAHSVRGAMLSQARTRALSLPPILVLNSDDFDIVRMAVGPRETLTGREVRVCLATGR